MKREMVTTQPGQVTIATSSSCFFPPRRPPFLIADAARLRQSVQYIFTGKSIRQYLCHILHSQMLAPIFGCFHCLCKIKQQLFGFLFLSSHDDHIYTYWQGFRFLGFGCFELHNIKDLLLWKSCSGRCLPRNFYLHCWQWASWKELNILYILNI